MVDTCTRRVPIFLPGHHFVIPSTSSLEAIVGQQHRALYRTYMTFLFERSTHMIGGFIVSLFLAVIILDVPNTR